MKISLMCVALVLVVGAATANADSYKPADIVWLIDTSGSMSGDIGQVVDRIDDFHAAMQANNIDAQYGLVRFGGYEQVVTNITDFTTFDTALGLLVANQGNPEDGSAATLLALNSMTGFRTNAVKNFILVTDEDDDSDGSSNYSGPWATVGAADTALTNASALFNFIGVPGVGNTDNTYGVLAANHGGSAFSIYDFRSDPSTFFSNFIQTKVEEIINYDPNAVPLPGSVWMGLGMLSLLAAARRVRRRRNA